MPSITWNKPYVWISRDDYVAWASQIIDADNITWIETWYGWTLWPKATKKRLVWSKPRCIIENSYIWCEDWEIYKLWWADVDTAYYTFSSGWNVVKWVSFWSHWYFFTKPPTEDFANVDIYRISIADFWSGTFTSLWSVWKSMTHEYNPAIYEDASFLYIWWLDTIAKVTTSWTATDYWFPDWNVTWIASHGTRMIIHTWYSDEWKILSWDRTSANADMVQDIKEEPVRTISNVQTDYIVTKDGWLYIGWWLDMQNIMNLKQSRRLNDNSQYIEKFNFAPNLQDNNSFINNQDDLYIKTQSTIFKYGKLINWVSPSFNKIITQNHLWNDIDEIRDIWLQWDLMYFTSTSWTDYSVDYIDLSVLTTAEDWKLITDIVRWLSNENNQIIRLKALTSFTSWDNYIKWYKRINDWSWVLFITINNTTDTVDLEEINTETDEFYDIQIKWELHNDLQTNTPPILHEFYLEFDKVS